MLRYALSLLVGFLYTSALVKGQNFNGIIDESGQCLCKVVLPDGTFPMDRMESLEYYTYNLNITVHQEITKIQSYEGTFSLYLKMLRNLTSRVEVMEMGGASYTELDFELLKLEIKEIESLVVQLRASMNGSSVTVELLYIEIKNISVMVNQLESYDKNNVLAVRREIVALKKRLHDCETDQGKATPSPPIYGACNHGGLGDITKPHVVQLNHYGVGYRYGGWGKDSYTEATNKDMYFVAPLNTDARILQYLRRYPTHNDLLIYTNAIDKTLSSTLYGQGGGMIAYNNSLYYNCYNSRDICKLNFDTSVLERRPLPNAEFNNRFSYAAVTYQDMDFAADEDGLWVLYATGASGGNIIIGKINSNLIVENTWTTTQYKPGVTNAFMICGVLYATRPVSTRKEEIFYTYDTKTGKEGKISIMIDKMMETVQSLSYNANDHKLYMYNDGYEVTYDCIFSQIPAPN